MKDFSLSLNPIVKFLKKHAEDFQRKDLMKVIDEFQVKQLNLHYTGFDGKLKELKVPVNSLEYAELILAQGERIDGSSVFKGIVDTGKSDLYIVPIYRTAFMSPFEENTLGILCKVLDKDGEPAACCPHNILSKSLKHLKERTGLTLNALGELEFYIIYDQKDHLFRGSAQKGYHQSSPFVKSRQMINEMTNIISTLTGAVKYAHSEVGYIDSLKSDNPEIAGKRCEQYEIEFLPRPIEDMAHFLSLAKWVIRNVAYKWGCTATFTPKLEEGMAGTGLHFHMELIRNGQNVMTRSSGELSDEAKKLIAGLLTFAKSMTAFGNTVSSAYLRLVPHQEAPTRICWSEQNRSALVRIPLGWNSRSDFGRGVNPAETEPYTPKHSRQTIELRSPDGSAAVHLMLAAICRAAEYGLTHPESQALAERLHIKGNIFEEKDILEKLECLPTSCAESADWLEKQREFYEKDDVFTRKVVDRTIQLLLEEDDRNINQRFAHLTAEDRLRATRAIMHKDLHKH